MLSMFRLKVGEEWKIHCLPLEAHFLGLRGFVWVEEALLHDSDNPKRISKLRFWGKNAESMESVSYQHSCNNAGRTQEPRT